jgi:hypothetical protein
MPMYFIEENAVYVVEANSAEEAEEKFLKAIHIDEPVVLVDVPEREVYTDEESSKENEAEVTISYSPVPEQ